MNDSFEYITFLQYRVKELQNKVNELKSGDTYVKMCKKQQQRVRCYENLIKQLKKGYSSADWYKCKIKVLNFGLCSLAMNVDNLESV